MGMVFFMALEIGVRCNTLQALKFFSLFPIEWE